MRGRTSNPGAAAVIGLYSMLSYILVVWLYGSVRARERPRHEQRRARAQSRLTDHVVQDLNQEPEPPYPDVSFDAVINAVSIQYMTRPGEVFRSCAWVLRPGGLHLIATSHRCFPTKAIRAWHVLPPAERLGLVREYFRLA